MYLLISLVHRNTNYVKNESYRILYIILIKRKIIVYRTDIAIFKLLANLSKLDKVQKLQGIQRYRILMLIRKNKLTSLTIVFLEIDIKIAKKEIENNH